MGNVLAVAQQVAILFVLIGFGAALRKLKLLSDAAIEGLVNLLILFVTPCLIVDVFQCPFDPAMLKGLCVAFLVAVLGHVAVIALAYVCVRHRDENVRRPLMLAAVFSNAGFMGIPLEQALLGDRGVFFGAVYIVVFNLFMWSWGYGIMMNDERRVMNEGGGRKALDEAGTGRRPIHHSSFIVQHSLLNPGTIGIALGLPLFFLSVKLPATVGEPIHHLANLNTPLAMIIIGFCLANAHLGRVLRIGGVYVATAIRLVFYPLLIVAALYPFRAYLDRDMMLAMTIAASAPVAAMVSMFSAKFGRDVDTSVAMVSGTTLLSIVTMPVVIALAMKVL